VFDDQRGVRDALEIRLRFPFPWQKPTSLCRGFFMRLPPSIGMDALIDLLWIGN